MYSLFVLCIIVLLVSGITGNIMNFILRFRIKEKRGYGMFEFAGPSTGFAMYVGALALLFKQDTENLASDQFLFWYRLSYIIFAITLVIFIVAIIVSGTPVQITHGAVQ